MSAMSHRGSLGGSSTSWLNGLFTQMDQGNVDKKWGKKTRRLSYKGGGVSLECHQDLFIVMSVHWGVCLPCLPLNSYVHQQCIAALCFLGTEQSGTKCGVGSQRTFSLFSALSEHFNNHGKGLFICLQPSFKLHPIDKAELGSFDTHTQPLRV